MIDQLSYCTCELQTITQLLGVPIFGWPLVLLGYLIVLLSLGTSGPEFAYWLHPYVVNQVNDAAHACLLPMLVSTAVCILLVFGAVRLYQMSSLSSQRQKAA